MKEEEIEFANHCGEKLAATLHLPDGSPDRGVILGHCFTCSRHTSILRSICHALAASGFTVLRFDFSGNGQSEGEFTESTYSKQIAEMKTAAALLATHGVSWLGLAGHSMGAMVALLAAGEIKAAKAVCALAARSRVMGVADLLTPAQLKRIQETGRVLFVSRGRSLELTGEMFRDASRYDLGRTVASFMLPVLLVHGDQDEITPVDEAYRIQHYRVEGARLAVIPGADHMFTSDEHRRMVTEVVVRWFKEQAPGGIGVRCRGCGDQSL
jgi:putative redox protein